VATKSVSKAISQGQCAFCHVEFAKNKITQHLKACKQRQATIEAQEKEASQSKTNLFHILAEGKYNPEYWLHFELPATESLWVVDSFLKQMWIDDLEHLSGFKIDGTDYSDAEAGGRFSVDASAEESDDEEMSEEDEEKEISKVVDEVMSEFAGGSDSFYYSLPFGAPPLPAEWIAEIKKPRSVDERIRFLKDELASATQAHKAAKKDMWNTTGASSDETIHVNYLAAASKQTVIETLLEAVEDRSTDVLLKRVLKVGQKFSYTYDFGSSTYINLKVIAEREGIVPDTQESVQLLAQNTAPEFSCVSCGKPATEVTMGYFAGGIAECAYCATCASKRSGEDEDEGGDGYGDETMLPIINSPRVGVL
jgi:hypothetical protein